MKPWKTIETVETNEGRLELRRRGARDFLITIDGRVLMTSKHHRSESELAIHGCAPIASRDEPRLLTAGLGLGFTLRAALDTLPPSAEIVVAELNPVVVEWCHGPAAMLNDDPLSDPRVEVVVGDVMDCVRDVGRGVRAPFDAIVVDLFVGPGGDPHGDDEAVYGDAALASVLGALTGGGVYAVWGEEQHPDFIDRLRRAGFTPSCIRHRGPGRRHVSYIGVKPG